MTILQDIMWFAIDMGIIVLLGLLALWLLVRHTGRNKPSRSEILIEKAYEALKELEDYYDDFPEKEREKALKILKGVAVQLAGLDRKRIAKELEKK